MLFSCLAFQWERPIVDKSLKRARITRSAALSERHIMAKGKSSRKETKKPKKEKPKANAAAESHKAGTTIAGKKMV